jgi:hypothetical protein
VTDFIYRYTTILPIVIVTETRYADTLARCVSLGKPVLSVVVTSLLKGECRCLCICSELVVLFPQTQETIVKHVIFHILTAASMKFRVFWDVMPCSEIDVDRRFGGAYCLHHQDDDAARTSETSVNIYLTTRQYIT